MLKKYCLPLMMGLFLAGCSGSFNDRLKAGKSDYAQKNYTAAIEQLNLAITHWKTSDGPEKKAEALETLGQSYHALQKNDKAVENFKEAVRLSDKSYESAYQLGVMALASNDPQQALLDFRDALRMKIADPYALLGLGNAYFQMGDYRNAKLMYERVLDTAPGVRDALKFIQITDEKMAKKGHAIKPAEKKKSTAKTMSHKTSHKKNLNLTRP